MVTTTPHATENRWHLLLDADPARQAFLLLRTVFTIAPIVFGIDKFFNILTFWPHYLAPIVTDVAPMTGQQFMYIVGIIEIVAGLAVAFAPRWGSLLVTLWLAGIIINLLVLPGYFDVALRDFGLLVAALALWRLSVSPAARAQSHGTAA
ncbi:DoxX family membrane protein [Rathayibacter soli]|uniref:DoxX family membrane protein n=1 Tax=Rathayibacter soli TaxID=3144168 RepID=UPI0027E4D836|nr:DoxX family membrane protein [Glaciibacter superstes]